MAENTNQLSLKEKKYLKEEVDRLIKIVSEHLSREGTSEIERKALEIFKRKANKNNIYKIITSAENFLKNLDYPIEFLYAQQAVIKLHKEDGSNNYIYDSFREQTEEVDLYKNGLINFTDEGIEKVKDEYYKILENKEKGGNSREIVLKEFISYYFRSKILKPILDYDLLKLYSDNPENKPFKTIEEDGNFENNSTLKTGIKNAIVISNIDRDISTLNYFFLNPSRRASSLDIKQPASPFKFDNKFTWINKETGEVLKNNPLSSKEDQYFKIPLYTKNPRCRRKIILNLDLKSPENAYTVFNMLENDNNTLNPKIHAILGYQELLLALDDKDDEEYRSSDRGSFTNYSDKLKSNLKDKIVKLIKEDKIKFSFCQEGEIATYNSFNKGIVVELLKISLDLRNGQFIDSVIGNDATRNSLVALKDKIENNTETLIQEEITLLSDFLNKLVKYTLITHNFTNREKFVELLTGIGSEIGGLFTIPAKEEGEDYIKGVNYVTSAPSKNVNMDIYDCGDNQIISTYSLQSGYYNAGETTKINELYFENNTGYLRRKKINFRTIDFFGLNEDYTIHTSTSENDFKKGFSLDLSKPEEEIENEEEPEEEIENEEEQEQEKKEEEKRRRRKKEREEEQKRLQRKFNEALQGAYDEGFNEGHNEGYEDGLADQRSKNDAAQAHYQKRKIKRKLREAEIGSYLFDYFKSNPIAQNTVVQTPAVQTSQQQSIQAPSNEEVKALKRDIDDLKANYESGIDQLKRKLDEMSNSQRQTTNQYNPAPGNFWQQGQPAYGAWGQQQVPQYGQYVPNNWGQTPPQQVQQYPYYPQQVQPQQVQPYPSQQIQGNWPQGNPYNVQQPVNYNANQPQTQNIQQKPPLEFVRTKYTTQQQNTFQPGKTAVQSFLQDGRSEQIDYAKLASEEHKKLKLRREYKQSPVKPRSESYLETLKKYEKLSTSANTIMNFVNSRLQSGLFLGEKIDDDIKVYLENISNMLKSKMGSIKGIDQSEKLLEILKNEQETNKNFLVEFNRIISTTKDPKTLATTENNLEKLKYRMIFFDKIYSSLLAIYDKNKDIENVDDLNDINTVEKYINPNSREEALKMASELTDYETKKVSFEENGDKTFLFDMKDEYGSKLQVTFPYSFDLSVINIELLMSNPIDVAKKYGKTIKFGTNENELTDVTTPIKTSNIHSDSEEMHIFSGVCHKIAKTKVFPTLKTGLTPEEIANFNKDERIGKTRSDSIPLLV